ncbi:hypothetical protein U0070_008838 [Myodes glareolus]|uniref:Large ribosomal subunit protein uL23 N-terminal domain-containing protein n=1 Tax=Myodes glareolus TaxID=447135 RepID=A0AAW0IIW0_MYOGA
MQTAEDKRTVDRRSKEVELLLRGRAVLFRPKFLKTGTQNRKPHTETTGYLLVYRFNGRSEIHGVQPKTQESKWYEVVRSPGTGFSDSFELPFPPKFLASNSDNQLGMVVKDYYKPNTWDLKKEGLEFKASPNYTASLRSPKQQDVSGPLKKALSHMANIDQKKGLIEMSRKVQEGEYPNRLDPQNPVYAEETSLSIIVNGFSGRLRASHIQRVRPNSENLTLQEGSQAKMKPSLGRSPKDVITPRQQEMAPKAKKEAPAPPKTKAKGKALKVTAVLKGIHSHKKKISTSPTFHHPPSGSHSPASLITSSSRCLFTHHFIQYTTPIAIHTSVSSWNNPNTP